MHFGSFDGLIDNLGIIIIIGSFLAAGFVLNRDARR